HAAAVRNRTARPRRASRGQGRAVVSSRKPARDDGGGFPHRLSSASYRLRMVPTTLFSSPPTAVPAPSTPMPVLLPERMLLPEPMIEPARTPLATPPSLTVGE